MTRRMTKRGDEGATPLVFVYGTLKRGFHNHRVMRQAGGEFVCGGRHLGSEPAPIRKLHTPDQH